MEWRDKNRATDKRRKEAYALFCFNESKETETDFGNRFSRDGHTRVVYRYRTACVLRSISEGRYVITWNGIRLAWERE